jgi:Zn-dependent metalloprotease
VTRNHPYCLHCITPPYILLKLLESKDKEIRQAALNTLLTTARFQGERQLVGGTEFAAMPAQGQRSIYSCRNSQTLASAVLVRPEDGGASSDDSANRAFDGFGITRDFYKQVFDRNSIDDRGLALNGYIHYGDRYNNAYWNGRQMIFGDGDGQKFTDFTKSLDVIAHELTHGVTQYTADLDYHNQSGALNESVSDVFGSLVKQWSLSQTADEADWLIGVDVFTPGIEGDALRSMKAPGTAFDNDLLGKDPQPDHISRYVPLPDTFEGDWGGVHINSGIPNKAFYLTAVGIGGQAWEAPGHIWYESLLASNPSSNFQDFADSTYLKAGQLYGASGAEQQAVLAAWREVGVRITGATAQGATRRVPAGAGATGARNGDTLAALTKQIEALAKEVKALAKDVHALKGKK